MEESNYYPNISGKWKGHDGKCEVEIKQNPNSKNFVVLWTNGITHGLGQFTSSDSIVLNHPEGQGNCKINTTLIDNTLFHSNGTQWKRI